MNIFLICPVAKITPEIQKRIAKYVDLLEKHGNAVHWPVRDTNQKDLTGGYTICKTNFEAIYNADQIHIWYDETSGGSKFDFGGVFMLSEILGFRKKLIIVNDGEVEDASQKSFYKVLKYLIARQQQLTL